MVVASPEVTRPSDIVVWIAVPSPTPVTSFIEVILAGPVATPSVTGLTGGIIVGVVTLSACITIIGIVFVFGEASATVDAYYGTILLVGVVSNMVRTRFVMVNINIIVMAFSTVASPAVFVCKGINARAVVVLSAGAGSTGIKVVIDVAFPAIIIFVEVFMVSLVASSTVTRQ